MNDENSKPPAGARGGATRKGWVRATAEPAGPVPANLQEAMDRLAAQSPPHPYPDQVASAIRRMGHVLHLEPRQIPTDPQRLRALLAQALPAIEGMSDRRWARICSLVRTYLRAVGVEIEPGRHVAGHSAEWRVLALRAPKADAVAVSRFMSFCTREGLVPADVSLATFEVFRAAMSKHSLSENHDAIYRNTVTHWNRAVASVEGWPDLRIPQARHPRFFSLDWAAFPAAYRAKIDALLAPRTVQNIFSEDYRRPLRSSTANFYRRQLRVVSSLLIEAGFPIDQLVSLEILVTPANVKLALGRQLERSDGRVTSSIIQTAELLQRLAKSVVKREDYASILSRYVEGLADRRASVEGTMTMVQRNRDRLQQFDVPANVKTLVTLPDVVFAEARLSEKATPKLARRVMLAVAVEILLATALRGGNLTALEIDRHFITATRRGTSVRSVRIPAQEMKNHEAFEMNLPERTMVLMDEYLRDYRPMLGSEGSPYLFPGCGESRRDSAHFASAISKFVRQETGLEMHVHLFRHVVVKIHLDHHPDDIETPRRFLQHKSTKTTLQHYAEPRSDRAFARWHGTLEAERQNGSFARA